MSEPIEKAGEHRFGFVTLAGPPNAGKSTLINRLMGEKISIISRRPQTTRHRILAIKTMEEAQIVFVDTPGLHHDQKKNLNRVINKTAINSLSDVDLILFMIDCKGWQPMVVKSLKQVIAKGTPIILLINKVDMVKDKLALLPLIEESSNLHDFSAIIPISAIRLDHEKELIDTVVKHLPHGPPGFPADQTTTAGDRFHAAELVREQTFLLLGKELPYESAVEVTRFDQNDADFYYIDMIIWVERDSQKSIIIGRNGSMLKKIGERGRKSIERQFSCRVHLNLWVKQRKGWGDNISMLQSLGYTEE